MRRLGVICGAPRRQGRESGQATVEFALILFPLLILVVGIIQFGIGLSYWLDMNRLANQGARWAVVNGWPGCPRTGPSACTATPACTSAMTDTTLPNLLRCQALTQGLQSSVTATVCYPTDGDTTTGLGEVGTPVRVELNSPYGFRLIMKLGTLNLSARATMRIENNLPTNHLTGTPGCNGATT